MHKKLHKMHKTTETWKHGQTTLATYQYIYVSRDRGRKKKEKKK
jgi:hypothetical protein